MLFTAKSPAKNPVRRYRLTGLYLRLRDGSAYPAPYWDVVCLSLFILDAFRLTHDGMAPYPCPCAQPLFHIAAGVGQLFLREIIASLGSLLQKLRHIFARLQLLGIRFICPRLLKKGSCRFNAHLFLPPLYNMYLCKYITAPASRPGFPILPSAPSALKSPAKSPVRRPYRLTGLCLRLHWCSLPDTEHYGQP